MSSKHRMRGIHSLLAMLLAAATLFACSTNPGKKSDRWITSDTAACVRLIVSWDLETALLQDIVGVNFTPAEFGANGEGQLQLSVMSCGESLSSGAKTQPEVVAYVMIPLAANRVPVTISGVSRDAWLSLPLTLVDNTLAVSELFSRHGYVVMDTAISFATSRAGDETLLRARLQFENGSISVVATASGEPMSHEINSALLGTGADRYSALFGKETARRYSLVSATVRVEGQTVLSDLNLSETPAMALFDTDLVSNRIFWHESLSER